MTIYTNDWYELRAFRNEKKPGKRGRQGFRLLRRKMRAVHLSHIPSDARNASSRVSAHTVHNYSSMWLTYRLSSFSSPLFALTTGFIWRFFLFAIFLCSVLEEFFCFGIQFGHSCFQRQLQKYKNFVHALCTLVALRYPTPHRSHRRQWHRLPPPPPPLSSFLPHCPRL